MLLTIDPRVDYAFKGLFARPGREGLLLALLNAVLTLPRPLRHVALLNPFDEKEFADDKLAVLDLRARDDAGRWHNIEMQIRPDGYFVGRIVYYLAGMFHGQLREGDGYDLLAPVIGVHFVDRVLLPDRPGHHHRFHLADGSGQPLTDLLRLDLVELPKYRALGQEPTDDFGRFCYLFSHAVGLDTDALPAALSTPIMQEAVRALAMMQQTPAERMAYEERLRRRRDHDAAMLWERREGRAEGRTEGRAEAARAMLGEVLEARFGAAGKSAAARLADEADPVRLQGLVRQAATAATLEEALRHD